jgi:hypothetical protein
MSISVTDPIGRAINRAKYITFQPFDIGKWFVLGFIAWLAALGEGGGFGGGGGNFPGGGGGTGPGPGTDPFQEAWDWVSAHLAEVILIGAVILVAILAIWLLLVWVSSRGRFMFLEAIANNTYEVVAPWKRHRFLGNSYMAFRICLALVAVPVTLAILLLGFALALPDIRARSFGGAALAGTLVSAALIVVSSIVFGIVSWCTRNFVTTIMSVLPAWSEFRNQVVPGHLGSLTLFLLMRIVLALAIGILSAIIGCVTCCIGFLPYLSTVVTLPLHVFNICYAVYFLQQFDPAYVIIREPAPPTGFPVVEFPQPPETGSG